MTFISWLNTHYEDRGPMKALAFFFELIAAIALFALMVLTCIDVIGRYFLNNPVIGASELTKIGLAIIIFAVMPVVTWRGGHIAVDLIDNFLPKVVLRIFAFVSMLIISTSLYFVSIRIWELGARMLRRNITTDFLHIQSGYVLQCIAILSWLTAISALIYLLLTTFRAKPPESVSGAKE